MSFIKLLRNHLDSIEILPGEVKIIDGYKYKGTLAGATPIGFFNTKEVVYKRFMLENQVYDLEHKRDTYISDDDLNELCHSISEFIEAATLKEPEDIESLKKLEWDYLFSCALHSNETSNLLENFTRMLCFVCIKKELILWDNN